VNSGSSTLSLGPEFRSECHRDRITAIYTKRSTGNELLIRRGQVPCCAGNFLRLTSLTGGGARKNLAVHGDSTYSHRHVGFNPPAAIALT